MSDLVSAFCSYLSDYFGGDAGLGVVPVEREKEWQKVGQKFLEAHKATPQQRSERALEVLCGLLDSDDAQIRLEAATQVLNVRDRHQLEGLQRVVMERLDAISDRLDAQSGEGWKEG